MNCSFYHYYDGGISYCTKSNECPKEYDKLIEDKSECVSNCSKDGEYKFEFRKNCYKKCPSNSILIINSTDLEIFNIKKKYFCKPICNEETPFEIIDTQECVKSCTIKNIIDNLCILNFKINAYDIMLKNIENNFTSEEYDTSRLDNGINDIIEYNKMKIILTTTKYQSKNMNNPNETTIDLGKCELILREKYNISYKESLYMRRIDMIQEGMKIPKIIYDIYSKFNKTRLVKLNLSYCNNNKVDISIPVILTESKNIHNSSSEYYNDICYPAKSEYGTDIISKDRKKEFIEKIKQYVKKIVYFLIIMIK
jgi:hypothetical protein